MPVYDFACLTCGFHFEQNLSFSDKQDSIICPQCKARARRVFTKPAVIFKGNGFYVTDQRSKAASSAGEKS